MSLWDCIQEAVDGNEMSAERGREAQDLFNRLRADYEARVGPEAAQAQAADDVKKIMGARAGEKRRQMTLRLRTAQRNTARLAQHRTLSGKANPADALRVFIEGDENSAIQGIVPLSKSLKGFYHAELVGVLQSFGRNIFGTVRNKAKLASVVDELFGKASGDEAAAEMAGAVRKVLNMARKEHNAAGGNVGFLENYGLAMNHNGRKILDTGFEAWRDGIWNRLDWNRIIDHDTDQPFAIAGGVPPRGARAEEFLTDIYRSITTEGWSKREANFHDRGLTATKRRDTSRVLHFKDGENWLAYNTEFGSDDPFTNIVTTLDGYARDTAAMRVLGPNPRAGLSYLAQVVDKTAHETPWDTPSTARKQSTKASHKAKAMLDLYSGAAQTPVDGLLAEFLAGTRGVLVSAQLGAAAISAVTDVGFQAAAARKIGMDPGKVISRIGKELKGDSANALRKGLISDQLANVGAAQARYMGDVFTPEIAARLSDFVMRASGLSKWTEAGRHAFQLEFMGFLADNVRHGFEAMNPSLRKVLERKGFTAAEWDTVRTADLHNEDGATFLVPQMMRYRTDIPEDMADDLAARLMSVIHEQTEFAIPSASLEGQAIALDATRPGTLIGELARSGFMYKTFGLSVLFNQARRTMAQDTKWDRFAYAAGMGAMVTTMGALSLQMKEMVKGRDPRPMGNWEFVGASVLQGGGLGIFGDFLSSETNRFGGGLPATLAGPVVGLASDLTSLGVTAARAPFSGEGNLGREAVNLLRYNTPVTGIWYWGSAFQRLLFDNLQKMADPDAERAWRRAERRRVEANGNPAWWGAGEMLPQRGPDLANVAR